MRKIILVCSLVVNAIFMAVVIMAVSGKNDKIAVMVASDLDKSYVSSAMIISVPPSGGVVFNTVEITLEEGERAYLQFSGFVDGSQANWIMETLYDHKIIEVRKSGFGLSITALNQGETVMQTLASDGFRDVALIKVAGKK